MKVKSLVVVLVLLVAGVSFIAYSTNAQKTAMNQQVKGEGRSDENFMRELRNNVVCTTLYENMLAKEAEQWTIKRARCENSYAHASLMLSNGNEKLEIAVLDVRSPDEAKKVVNIPHGQSASPSKDYGDQGRRVVVDGKVRSIEFVKGRIYAHIECNPCNSSETPKRFAEYVLKAIEGQ